MYILIYIYIYLYIHLSVYLSIYLSIQVNHVVSSKHIFLSFKQIYSLLIKDQKAKQTKS